MKISLSVTGMHCDSCVEAVKDALAKTTSIIECDVRVGSVVVTFDEAQAGTADILAAIRGAGPFDISGFSTSP